jgi:class 3 adenylate cyclase
MRPTPPPRLSPSNPTSLASRGLLKTQLKVRIALHTGEADLRDGDYYGTVINRCARLRALAVGGQVLTGTTRFKSSSGALPVC